MTHASSLIPDITWIAPPDLTDLSRYRLRYYATTIPSILRRHRLRNQIQTKAYQTTFRFTYAQKQQWLDLFDAPGIGHDTTFTYYTMAGTLLLSQILNDIGINFRHLLHLKSQMAFHQPASLSRSNHTYSLTSSLQDVAVVRQDRVALIVESIISDEAHKQLATCTDTFIVLNLNPGQMTKIAANRRFGQADGAALTKRPSPQFNPATRRRTAIPLPHGIGARYGRLSGDLNLVHTTRLAAKLFGYKRPFVQGLFLANHVLKELTAANGRLPRQFDIHFCRPAFTGQTIDLVYDDAGYALRSSDGEIIAAGHCHFLPSKKK